MNKIIFTVLVIGFIWSACGQEKKNKPTSNEQKEVVNAPSFNADTAYYFIARQVSFGPRVPNTKSHLACANYLEKTLQKYGANVIVQKASVTAFDNSKLNIRNILATFHPEKTNRILVCAHWDTRPFADQDLKDRNKPIDGANDGGSGVGVLLEVARQLALKKPDVGIDIIFFDAEDYGQPDDSNLPMMRDSYCLGSQYWAKNNPTFKFKPYYGILLDMVGGANITFAQEEISRMYAPALVEKIWNIGANSGYSDHFPFKQTGAIIDDHYYINTLANIPTIDLIHHDETTPSGFWKHWHTHEDKLENIDKNSLKVTGQTLLNFIYTEKVL